jgi:predicted MPP superfamily phosphohydrolase
MMIVKEDRIKSKSIPKQFDGVKIIQFSDLHYGTTFFEKHLKKMVKEINDRNPDLVVFTGDLIDKEYKINSDEIEMINKYLSRIKTKLGKYAVSGEEDNEDFTTIMNQSGFTILNNDYELLYNDGNEEILLVGLDSSLSGKQDIKKAYEYFSTEGYNSNIYTISLVHEPDSVSEMMQYKNDLIFAGHSHNGNIRIPFIGALSKVEGAKKYDQAYYKIKDTHLFISSGMGTNGPGFRLFNRPSINFIRLGSK